MGFGHNQFCEYIKASTVLGANELREGSKTRPLMVKADSKATVGMGIDKISRAIWASIGNLVEFTFHQFKISKLAFNFSTSSVKYRYIFDLLSTSLLEAQYLLNLFMKGSEWSLLSLSSIVIDEH
jgi:hypothetical protein